MQNGSVESRNAKATIRCHGEILSCQSPQPTNTFTLLNVFNNRLIAIGRRARCCDFDLCRSPGEQLTDSQHLTAASSSIRRLPLEHSFAGPVFIILPPTPVVDFLFAIVAVASIIPSPSPRGAA